MLLYLPRHYPHLLHRPFTSTAKEQKSHFFRSLAGRTVIASFNTELTNSELVSRAYYKTKQEQKSCLWIIMGKTVFITTTFNINEFWYLTKWTLVFNKKIENIWILPILIRLSQTQQTPLRYITVVSVPPIKRVKIQTVLTATATSLSKVGLSLPREPFISQTGHEWQSWE